MSNEEKILAKLEKMSSDIDILKAKVEHLEHSGRNDEKRPSIDQQLDAIDGLAHMLDADEKKRFGAFMDAEKVRKATAYA